MIVQSSIHAHSSSSSSSNHGNGRPTPDKRALELHGAASVPRIAAFAAPKACPQRAPKNLYFPSSPASRLLHLPVLTDSKVLKTSLTPSATGSAFLELSAPSTLKISASVYGPRPLPPQAGFSPNARITAELKFAPFSTEGSRRGYVRDALERDLSMQLQIALARSVRTAAYPKSGIDVFVTVLDCEGSIDEGGDGLGCMQTLAGAITCSSAAIADAGIECVDLVSAGIAAVVAGGGGDGGGDGDGGGGSGGSGGEQQGEAGHGSSSSGSGANAAAAAGGVALVMDPSPLDRYEVKAAALVGYMAGRDELTLVWTKGELEVAGAGNEFERVVDKAVEVATQVRAVLNEAVQERPAMALEAAALKAAVKGKQAADVEMAG